MCLIPPYCKVGYYIALLFNGTLMLPGMIPGIDI